MVHRCNQSKHHTPDAAVENILGTKYSYNLCTTVVTGKGTQCPVDPHNHLLLLGQKTLFLTDDNEN